MGTFAGVTPVTCGPTPRKVRTIPTPSRTNMQARNRYVGLAKIVPLSRTPRRLTAITARMHSTIRGTLRGARTGNAE